MNFKWQQDLIKDIRFNDHRDFLYGNDNSLTDFSNITIKLDNSYTSLSRCNLIVLKSYFDRIKKNAQCIVEIGIDRVEESTEFSFTNFILKNKNKETSFIRIDNNPVIINDRGNNVFTLDCNPTDIESIKDFLNSVNITQVDFLFIDKWNSINNILKIWEFSSMLSGEGIVAFHDTTSNFGPLLFLSNLNKNKWNVVKNSCKCEKINEDLTYQSNDYGIGFVWRRK